MYRENITFSWQKDQTCSLTFVNHTFASCECNKTGEISVLTNTRSNIVSSSIYPSPENSTTVILISVIIGCSSVIIITSVALLIGFKLKQRERKQAEINFQELVHIQ